MLDEWIMDDRVILKKNLDYSWGTGLSENKGPAKIDKLVIREMKEEATVFMELKSGGVDIAEGVPAIFLEKLKRMKYWYYRSPECQTLLFSYEYSKRTLY